MTTSRDQAPPPPHHPVALVIATLFAPVPFLAPIFFVVAQDEVARAESVLGMYSVSVGVAGALLIAAGRRGRAQGRVVGLIWIIAGAAAAAVFAQPSNSHIGGGYAQDVVVGAFLGAFASSVFSGLRRLFSPRVG